MNFYYSYYNNHQRKIVKSKKQKKQKYNFVFFVNTSLKSKPIVTLQTKEIIDNSWQRIFFTFTCYLLVFDLKLITSNYS